MPQATITVAGITPPAPGKKQGKIIDVAGAKWNVWGDKIQNYRIGVTYDIIYTPEEFNNVAFNLIKTAEPAGHGAAQAAAPILRVTEVGSMVERAKDQHIFVCGALNNALSNSNINPFEMQPTEIATFVRNLQQVWKQTLGSQKARTEDQMSDSIPF